MILAAGQSRRMGQPKQLMDYAGRTFIETIVCEALGAELDGLVAVINPLVQREIEERISPGCELVVNSDPDSEMRTSVACGLDCPVATNLDVDDGLLILLGDQPQVTASMITAVASAFKMSESTSRIVIATYGGRRSHPAVFPVGLVRDHLKRGAGGLNDLAKGMPEAIQEVEIQCTRAPIDVDTLDDYRRLQS
jgi:molybdenum cofactor cytidylyltransferase